MPTDFIQEMTWRGLVHQTTGADELRAHLNSGTRKAYVGFDPTADSLTIGNLVGIMALVRFAQAGHQAIVLVGGATGLIGDPSGKSAERTLNTPDTVAANVRGQQRIFDSVWKNAGLQPPAMRNNYDWFKSITFLDALRDIGKHFSVNMMIQKESVKERLTNRDQGISYTEFSYMLLQAYDFKHLWEHEGVTFQMGGSDQFGNIVCGVDLIRRRSNDVLQAVDAYKGVTQSPTATSIEREEASRRLAELVEWSDNHPQIGTSFGMTWPLVTKADGGKFGKTESGAIWLTADRTSPYAFYQFWLNAADADVLRFLRIFTLMSEEEVLRLEAAHAANPGAREAHRALARHMTTLLHGQEQTDLAENAAKALFSGNISEIPASMLRDALAGAPQSTHDRSLLTTHLPFVDFLVATGVASSKREAREFLSNGSIMASGIAIKPEDVLSDKFLIDGSLLPIRRGKKTWHIANFE